jgi:hypothetical protein
MKASSVSLRKTDPQALTLSLIKARQAHWIPLMHKLHTFSNISINLLFYALYNFATKRHANMATQS